jgi:hypothetical protein
MRIGVLEIHPRGRREAASRGIDQRLMTKRRCDCEWGIASALAIVKAASRTIRVRDRHQLIDPGFLRHASETGSGGGA